MAKTKKAAPKAAKLFVSVEFSGADGDRIREAARRDDRPVSSWVRRVILEAVAASEESPRSVP